MVATTDAYTYIGVIAEVLNEGLPRAAWNIIADRSNRSLTARHALSNTLIAVQTILGLIMSIAFVAAARNFADAFVPEESRSVSLNYVRIAAFSEFRIAIRRCRLGNGWLSLSRGTDFALMFVLSGHHARRQQKRK